MAFGLSLYGFCFFTLKDREDFIHRRVESEGTAERPNPDDSTQREGRILLRNLGLDVGGIQL